MSVVVLGLGSMHHRNTDTREAAGSRKWSMEEAEELARQAEELAKVREGGGGGTAYLAACWYAHGWRCAGCCADAPGR